MISFLITLVIIGALLYIVNTLVPMDARIKTVINVVVLILVLLYVLELFGIIPANSAYSFHHLRN